MKKLVIAVALGVIAVVVGAGVFAAAVESEQPASLRDFMRAKLSHSQKVLEGLTSGDFDLIAKNSQAMSLLSQESNWNVLQTKEYLERSQDFRRTCDSMTEAARKKNLDGAALAYVDLTMKCINCHKYVRGVQMPQTNLPERAKP